MNFIQQIFSDQLTYAVSNALLHSLWQGGLIAFGLALSLHFLRNQTARFRYRLITGALLFFFAGNIATGLYSYQAWSPAPELTVNPDRLIFTDMTPLEAGIVQNGLKSENSLVYAFSYALTLYRQSSSVVLAVWLIGMLLFSMKLSTGLAYTYRLRSSGIPNRVPEQWQKSARAMADRLGIRSKFDLAESGLADTPMVIGIIRPMILLPLGTFTGTEPAHLEAILAHELAHIHRRDYLVNLLMQVLESLYFYHPAVWFMLEIARTEREHCCDDIAVSLTGTPTHLVMALGKLGIQQSKPAKASLAMGFGQKRTPIADRMKRLLGQGNPSRYLGERLVAAVALIVTAGLLHVSAISGDNVPGDQMPVPPTPPEVPAAPGTPSSTAAHPLPESPALPQDTVHTPEGIRNVPEGMPAPPSPEALHLKIFDKLTDAMKEDGLINESEAYSITFNQNELIINGEKQPASVYRKYRNMYEKDMGKVKASGSFNWHINHDPEMKGASGAIPHSDQHRKAVEMAHQSREQRLAALEQAHHALELHRADSAEHSRVMKEAFREAEKHRAEAEKEMKRVLQDTAVWRERLKASEEAMKHIERFYADSSHMRQMFEESQLQALSEAHEQLEHMKDQFNFQEDHLQEMMEGMKMDFDIDLDSTYFESIRDAQKELQQSIEQLKKEIEEEQ
ncbi:M56 family metallopeptidase [Roseivirga sp. BDSF3-8]|uniref:M56 family metallopeptidase n=1 Tax=Roseivirga sp. BDSF3-8 TaxID=3241598 RepID=UPI003532092A